MVVNPQEEEWEAIYFQPGQIVFLVISDSNEPPNDDLISRANKLGETMGLQITKPRTQKFSSTPSRDSKFEKGSSPEEEASGKGQPRLPLIVGRGPFALVHADVNRLDNGKKLSDEPSDVQSLLKL